MDRFTDKVVIVTGASSGIGQATALRLGSEGGAVACLDIDLDAAEKTAARIAEAGGRALAIGCNVADAAAVQSAVDRVVAELGRPNVVCNIAGVGKFANTHEETLESWDRIIGVNLTGTFLLCRATLPHLLDGGGAIVNTASTAGLQSQPYSAAYCASKGGVVQLTKALAWEYIGRGVRVNAVAPGGVETPILKDFSQLPEGANFDLLGKITSPMGFMPPDRIAALFAFLGSDEADYVTGSIYTMDGGITA